MPRTCKENWCTVARNIYHIRRRRRGREIDPDVVQSWFGVICPLTIWEMALRRKAGAQTYDTTFMTHWVGELLYYDAPQWVFVVAYTVFAALVVLSWFWVSATRARIFLAC